MHVWLYMRKAHHPQLTPIVSRAVQQGEVRNGFNSDGERSA